MNNSGLSNLVQKINSNNRSTFNIPYENDNEYDVNQALDDLDCLRSNGYK